MESLLITGGSGFLGGNLASAAVSARCRTFATCYRCTLQDPRLNVVCEFDLRDRATVQRTIEEISPKAVIHTAAIASADRCAEDRRLAWEVNVAGTQNLAMAARRVGARLIYISTDLVFAGDRGFYSEEDLPRPVCYYGETKLEAEKIVVSSSSNYCIARIPLLYGWSVNTSGCFTEILIDRLRKAESIELFTDEYRTPMFTGNLCRILLELARREDLQGLYHVSGHQRLSRFEFGRKLAQVFGFAPQLLRGVPVDDRRFKDKRPRDCSLCNEKASGVLETKIAGVEEGLKQMKAAAG